MKHVLPAFEDAAMILKTTRPDLRLVVAAADPVAEVVKARVAGWPRRAHVLEGERDKFDAMRAATVALACSGTVTTELAVAGCPMVVGYRGHPATAVVARAIIRTRYFTLFNIAADRMIAPEFLQEHCNGPELAKAVAALLDDPARRAAQAAAQTAALAKLGLVGTDPFETAAGVVVSVAEGSESADRGCSGAQPLWIGSIQAMASGFSAGSMSRFTTTASLSLRTSTHSSVSSAEALISWCGTNGGT